MPDPYTIRPFVSHEDQERTKIVDQLNRSSVGLTFPRADTAGFLRKEVRILPALGVHDLEQPFAAASFGRTPQSPPTSASESDLRDTVGVPAQADLQRIEPYDDEGKRRIAFTRLAQPFSKPVSFADAPQEAMHGPRHTSLAKVLTAHTIKGLFGEPHYATET